MLCRRVLLLRPGARLLVPSTRAFFNGAGSKEIQSFTVTKVIKCDQQQMFDIVNGVENYKEFVPFVEDSYIKSKDDAGKPNVVGLQIGWKHVDEVFDCKISSVPYEKVEAESVTDSLFDKLHTVWKFSPYESQIKGAPPSKGLCNVELTLNYKFKNPMYNAFSHMFSEPVTTIMIDAFEKRVAELNKKSS